MLSKYLMVTSAGIILTLGLAHLIYTFWGPNLTPRDPTLQFRMSEVSPVITNETSMWKTWIGFNASHSLVAILFGLIYGYLALTNNDILLKSPFLLIVGLAFLGSFVVLGKLYWFSVPFRGICAAFACYVAAIAMYFS